MRHEDCQAFSGDQHLELGGPGDGRIELAAVPVCALHALSVASDVMGLSGQALQPLHISFAHDLGVC